MPQQRAILSPVNPQAMWMVFESASRRDKALQRPFETRSCGASIRRKTHGSRQQSTLISTSSRGKSAGDA